MPHPQPDGFLATPPNGKGSPVLVLHPWWGLNDTIKALCKRLADAGFVAFAADLYHGKVTDQISEAEKLGAALDARFEEARAEVANAAEFLKDYTGSASIAVIGFSLGAFYAMDLSAKKPESVRAVVLFYGSGPADFSASQAAYLGHYAELDEYEPLEYIRETEADLKKAGRPVTFYTYPGTHHWFFEPDRVDAYNPEAANLAWERTLAFLRQS